MEALVLQIHREGVRCIHDAESAACVHAVIESQRVGGTGQIRPVDRAVISCTIPFVAAIADVGRGSNDDRGATEEHVVGENNGARGDADRRRTERFEAAQVNEVTRIRAGDGQATAVGERHIVGEEAGGPDGEPSVCSAPVMTWAPVAVSLIFATFANSKDSPNSVMPC